MPVTQLCFLLDNAVLVGTHQTFSETFARTHPKPAPLVAFSNECIADIWDICRLHASSTLQFFEANFWNLFKIKLYNLVFFFLIWTWKKYRNEDGKMVRQVSDRHCQAWVSELSPGNSHRGRNEPIPTSCPLTSVDLVPHTCTNQPRNMFKSAVYH